MLSIHGHTGWISFGDRQTETHCQDTDSNIKTICNNYTIGSESASKFTWDQW